ncbi:MAG: hypothetical protein KKH94_11435 [Candidatus Omnitrophica bacterium]|nr:hypothetical protein [Candidatus Omnitrophota bacterium]
MAEKYSKKSISPNGIDEKLKVALNLNEDLSSLYHYKIPSIPRDEFLSAGLVGIARANKKFKVGNWGGYVKISIQNEMLGYCRQYRRYERVRQETTNVGKTIRGKFKKEFIKDKRDGVNIWVVPLVEIKRGTCIPLSKFAKKIII